MPPGRDPDPLVPERFRLGALIRVLADHLAAERVREVPTCCGVLQLRGQAANLDCAALALSPVPAAVLRTLARRPGEVVSRQRLLTALPGAADENAVEVAVGRLRSAIGRPGVVGTVVKRGYRLAVAS